MSIRNTGSILQEVVSDVLYLAPYKFFIQLNYTIMIDQKA